MRLKARRAVSLTLAAGAAAAALFVATAHGAGTPSTLSFVDQNRGTEFVTPAGSTSAFPGRLQIRDRIFSRDSLLQAGRHVGYDNELCTVTFDNHALCQVMLVLPGKGQIQASWLWIHWPSSFSGVIDGGTGTFAHATGQFTASVLHNATRITAKLR